MTFKVLTDDTQKVISRSVIRSARDSTPRSFPPNEDELIPEILKSKHDRSSETDVKPMPTIDVEDLIGRTFLMPRKEDGQRFRAKIVEAISDHERGLSEEAVHVKFRFTVNDEEFEEIVAYNELLNHIS